MSDFEKTEGLIDANELPQIEKMTGEEKVMIVSDEEIKTIDAKALKNSATVFYVSSGGYPLYRNKNLTDEVSRSEIIDVFLAGDVKIASNESSNYGNAGGNMKSYMVSANGKFYITAEGIGQVEIDAT